MKLYATVTSERASKGQGGNKEIRVQFTAGAESREKTYEVVYTMLGDNQVMLEVRATPYDNDYLLRLVDDYPDKTKGKQQKDKCFKCQSTEKGLTENDDGHLYCDDCWK